VKRPRRDPVAPEINVTPLVDVTLVLLIVFMVVTPYLQRGVEISLPLAQHAASRDDLDRDPVVVSMRRDGTLWLGTERVSREALADRLRAVLRDDPDREILFKGDAALSYREVRELLAWLRASGAPGVSLAAATKERG
jgi:biopolymer transport protein ExbD